MRSLYTLLIYITTAHLWVAQFFSNKMKLFIKGRTQVFDILGSTLDPTRKSIWFHCASLGEFEQGVPIIKAVKKKFPDHQIVVSFFSPSGYENKKNTTLADVVVYLPMDTISNAKRFIQAIDPALVLFIKYEFWPNYLLELQKENIPILLVSGLFRKEQLFFKSYGGFMRKALQSFHHIFVQDKASEALLKKHDLLNVSVSGDTRFDRVSHQIEQDNSLGFMEQFKQDHLCLVCGSTWAEDIAVLLPYLNSMPDTLRVVVAPHKIEDEKIENFRKKLNQTSVRYSQHTDIDLSQASVLIVDTIGLLTKIYSYADVAYIGGAMGSTGLHNILEAATFGVPIVIGKNYDEFPEAKRLRSLAGLFSVQSSEECSEILNKLMENDSFRNKTGMIAAHFVDQNTGATQKIMDYIARLHSDRLI